MTFDYQVLDCDLNKSQRDADRIIDQAKLDVARKVELESDSLYFTRYFFKSRFGKKMIVSWHHLLIKRVLDLILQKKIKRLIVNLPPGYTKTEQFVIGFISYCLALNSAMRFVHLSQSYNLALFNSTCVRSIVTSPEFLKFWNLQTRDDVNSKSLWYTNEGGGVYANSLAGQVLGFRAGHMYTDDFMGALIIDDPQKPGDGILKAHFHKANKSYLEVAATRLATEATPVIVVMQRLDYDDLSGFLLRGGSGEKWHHLNMPVFQNIKNKKSQEKNNEHTHAININYTRKTAWLWEYKHSQKNAIALQALARKYSAQYMQDPQRFDSLKSLWNEELINNAKQHKFINVQRTVVAIDPAASNTQTSDAHGIVVCSYYDQDRYSVDADYTLERATSAQWAQRAMLAYEKHDADAIVVEANVGGDMCVDVLRNAGFKKRIIKVHATKNKVARAEPVQALYSLHKVAHAPNLFELEKEMLAFDMLTGLAYNRSPNRVDAMVWALTELSKNTDLTALLKIALKQ